MNICKILCFGLLIAGVCISTGCVGSCPGELKISQNDKPVYEALVTFRENEKRKNYWDKAGAMNTPPAWSTKTFDPEITKNKTKMLLEDEVRISLKCETLRFEESVLIRDLVLVRDSIESEYWYLPDYEIERLKFILSTRKQSE